jgi:hypothetical protein
MSANVAANMARGNATISLIMCLFRSLTVRLLSNKLSSADPTGKSLVESCLVTKLANSSQVIPSPEKLLISSKAPLDVTCPIMLKTADCQLLVIQPIHNSLEMSRETKVMTAMWKTVPIIQVHNTVHNTFTFC